MIHIYRKVLLICLLSLFFKTAFSQNCTVNAGVATTICPGSTFTLTGSASGLFASGGTATWSQISGPGITLSATTISGSNATANVTGYATGNTYGFRLTGKCTDGSLVYQDVLYTTSNATTANAGPDIAGCPGTVSMAANSLASGETGTWTVISGSLPVPSPANSPTATINLPATTLIGATTYRWTVVNGSCTSYDDVIVTNRGGISTVSAGSNQSISCYSSTASALLAASYAGNNTGGQVGTWSYISGPSTPSFINIHTNNTTVSNLIQGSYKLRWTATGACASGVSDMTITVGPGTQSVTSVPNVAAANTSTYCDGRTSTTLTGPTPIYTNETATWSQTTAQASAGVVISNPNSPTTTITGLNGTTNRTFTYTITNSVTGCTSTGTYYINYTVPPSVVVNGGSSVFFVACDAVSASIPYTVAGGNQTQWALVSGPAGSTLGGSTGTTSYTTASASPQTINGLTVVGTYVIRFKRTTNNGSGGCSDAYQDVSISVTKSVTAANAGTKQVLACNTFSTNLQGNTPTSGTGKWTQLSGPNTATVTDPTLANTAISGLIAGSYTFRWIISGGEGSCGNSQADVSVVVASPAPTTSAAGSNIAACYATPISLTGNQPATNETGTWTVTPSGVTFTNTHDPNAVVTGLANNTAYTFTWTIANACGTSSSNVTITTSTTAGPKQAAAGADQCLAAGTTSFTLAGNATATGETGVWTLLSGSPNTPTFTNAYNTTVTGAINGTYKFEWSLAKGGCNVTRDTVFITISSAATIANAGTAVSQCGFADITLNGNNPTVGTGNWTQVEGPGGAVITNSLLRNTTVSGLMVGRYIFRWTISNGACSSNSADVIVNISIPPTTASAGADQSLCSTTSTTLAANTITVGKGLWSVVSGPNTPVFATSSNPATTVSGLITGTYLLRWSSTNGLYCAPSTDDMNIFVTQSANAGADQNLCSQSSTLLSGNERSTGTWSQVGSTPSVATITANSSNTAIITNLTSGGAYTFTYTVNAVGSCPQTTDDVVVNITPAPSAAQAGDDVSICVPTGTTAANTTVTLGTNSTAPTSGTGTWAVQSKPTGSPTPVFSNVNNINATFSNLSNGLYVLEWNVTNGNCTVNKDIVRVNIYAEPAAAVAGPDQNAACSSQITLAATSPAVGVGTWSQTGGPTLPAGSIDAPNSPTTSILNSTAGNTYTFTWTVSNGNICSPKTDDVQITVVAAPPAAAVAGAAQGLCNQYQTTLAAQAAGSGETGTWTMISKPAGAADAVFTDVNNATSGLSGLVQGTYTLRWTLTNAGTCTTSSDVTITVTNPPTTAVAGPDASYCLFNPVVLAATPATSGTGTWTVVTKPTSAPSPVFSSINAANASVTGLLEGLYTFKWATINGTCPVSESLVKINIYKCEIGVTKTAGTPVLQPNGSYNVTFTFNVTNTGSATLNGIQVTDDLQASFTGKNFSISSKNASGSLAINPTFNGTTDKNLLTSATSSLAASGTATITIVVNISL
ncbi:MAG: beta strand repeat-containing protein [Janthinobacterium lividum]